MRDNQEYIERAAVFTRLDDDSKGMGYRPHPPGHTPDQDPKTEGGASSSPSRSIGHTSVHEYQLDMNRDQSFMFSGTTNLPTFKHNLQNPIKECDTKFIVKGCGCGRNIFPRGCMNLNCVSCASFTGARRARSIFDRLTDFDHDKFIKPTAKHVIYTVFTIPPRLRGKYMVPKEITTLRRKVWNLLKKEYGAVFAVEVTHPIGEDDEGKFHPHLNFLWIQKSGLKGFVDVAHLRKEYAKILKYSGNPDLFTRYSDKLKKIWSWCKYVARIFPNFSKWCGSVKWFGTTPKRKPKPIWCCPECNEKFKILGSLHRFDVQEYESQGWKLGRDPPWYNDDKIQHFNRSKQLD